MMPTSLVGSLKHEYLRIPDIKTATVSNLLRKSASATLWDTIVSLLTVLYGIFKTGTGVRWKSHPPPEMYLLYDSLL